MTPSTKPNVYNVSQRH